MTQDEKFMRNSQGEETNKRKLFQNKSANIALIVMGGIVAAAIVVAIIFINM